MNWALILRITGITNFILLLLIIFSCRCVGVCKITKKLFDRKWFMAIYNKHCWYWYAFYVSVILHIIAGLYVFGPPWRF